MKVAPGKKLFLNFVNFTLIISGGRKWEHCEKVKNKIFHNTNQGIHY